MNELPENGNTPLTHEEFAKCWVWLDRRIRTLEITNKISIGLAIAIFVAVIVNGVA